MLPRKYYYVAVEYYDKDGNRTQRMFVNERAFGCMYSFVNDVNKAKIFNTLKDAKEFMKNYIAPTNAKVLYEDCYDQY